MSFQIGNLTCNHTVNPIGLDDLPHFSYQLVSSDPSDVLAAYQIQVRDRNSVVWDSGRVPADEQVLIPYGGDTLRGETRYFWRVLVWNNRGEKAASDEAFFETGRRQPLDWNAQWITADPPGSFIDDTWAPNTTAPYIRREFSVEKPVADATLYIAGVGYYECYINGVSVKDTVLDPAFTEYDKTVMYRTHKITSLRQGKNAIGVVLGNGFYNIDAEDVWSFNRAAWRDHPKCMLVLKLCYEDGSVGQIVSDTSFKGTTGPIVANDVRSVERYDAGRELGNWTMPGYNDRTWPAVIRTKAPGGDLQGQYTTPIRVVARYAPAAIQKIDADNWLVDVGVNTTGWAEISLTANKGTEIMLRYGEEFDENRELKRSIYRYLKPNGKDRFQTDYYIAKGEGRETWHPLFQYHGFRYIHIYCETGIPADCSVEIQEVRTALEVAGGFECSDETVNKIQEITCRSTRTNFHHMPTDCPHREKNGWTGDAQLSAEQLLLNFNGAGAYSRWMDDVIRAQRKTGQLPGIIPSPGWGYNWGSGPAWDSVCAIIPYTLYLYGGDKRILEKMYPCVKRYVAFCDTMATDGICEFGLGDWCPPPDAWHKQCEVAVTDTAYYYGDILILSKMAQILGYPEEAAFYTEKAAKVRAAFRRYFIRRTDTVLELTHCTKCQTTLGCMLYFRLVEENERALFVQELIREIHERDDHFDFGMLGAKFVCNALITAGEAELMIKAATQPTYPGWGNMVALGATTLWEDWQGTNSQHHHAYGDISACFYKGLAGITPDEHRPGFKNTVFRPQFVSTVDHVRAWHDSPYGRVESAWKRDGDTVQLTLTVPANCTGELILPKGMKLQNRDETRCTFGAGTHTFTAVWKQAQ